jgi:hypothetical protein
MPTTTEREGGARPRLELAPAQAAPTLNLRHESTLRPDDQPILSIRASVPKAEAQRFIAEALHGIRAFMQEHQLPPAGPPFSICRPRGSNVDIEAGWPTARRELAGRGRIHSGSLPRSLTGPRDDPGRVATPPEQ